jgi:putative membrane-bound dehydrogenase-like protein
MNRLRLLPLLGLFLSVHAAAQAQLEPAKALASFTVSDGLEISLWASEPAFTNPTCMDIDHQGRVWVCESVNYRQQLRKRPVNRPEGDRILILEDTRGTGKADKVTVFYQAPDLVAPLGIAVAKDPVGPGYQVYVCHSPDILLFEDKDGDGKADGPPKKLLSGFKGFDHDHGVHGILIGPDGKLYFSVGDQGVAGLVDKNGKTWTTNQSDCRAGTVWRCDVDGKNLEFLAHNFRNEYEPCVDSFGSVFVSDNDDDGNQQTRICYVMPGGNYGYHPRGPGQSHWHEEQPGVVPKILRTYFGSPTGICVYEGALLPEKYRGQLLHTDAGPRHLRCYHLTPDGAGYAVVREDMVQSDDNWFRPADVCVAPDGSVFVADWYDPGVGGHGMGDTTRGRIYRVAPKGHKPAVPSVDLDTGAGLTAALASPALSVRYMAMAKLQGMDRAAALRVLEPAALQKQDVWLRARALWQLGRLKQERPRALAEALTDKDARFRVLALRIAKDCYGLSAVDLAANALGLAVGHDPTPAVGRELLLGLRDVEPARAKPFILELAKKYDGKDRFYLAALGIAVGNDPERRQVVLSDFDHHFPEWNDRVADLAWEWRPPQVLPRLQKQLFDANLPAALRGRIVDILATADDPDAGKALLKFLDGDVPEHVRRQILANLQLFLPGKWRDLRRSQELTDAVKQLLSRSDTRGTGLALMAAAEMTGAVAKIAAIARDANETLAVRSAAVQTLGSLPIAEAVVALDALLQSEPALRREAVQALGRLTEPQAKRPSTGPALKVLQDLVQASERDLGLRQAALAALAGSRAGTEWLLDLTPQKQLPEGLRADAGRLLRNSPYQDLRNRALIAFPPPKRLDPNRLPTIAALLDRKGDPARGQQVLIANKDLQCLKCHTIRGVGGNIGPDLSVIGKKASRENLIESILLPSKAVADQYINWIVETKGGLALTGLIMEETAEAITLRDANGKDTRLALKDIEARSKSPHSLMPADLLAYMTEDDLVDLVDYLLGLKTPALVLDYWHIAGPFDNGPNDAGLDKVYPPEEGVDLKATYSGKSGPVKWRAVKPNDQGYFDLQAFLGNSGTNAVAYLYRAVESPVAQEAVVLLGTDDGAKLWVNHTLAHTNRRRGAAATEGEAIKVKLKKGRNPLLLKISNAHQPHGFSFTLLSEQELKRLEDR